MRYCMKFPPNAVLRPPAFLPSDSVLIGQLIEVFLWADLCPVGTEQTTKTTNKTEQNLSLPAGMQAHFHLKPLTMCNMDTQLHNQKYM